MSKIITKISMGLLLLLLSGFGALAQTRTITGSVTSAEDNQPIPSVTIMVKGSSTAARTDFDGKYSISVSNESTLVFSFVGYITKEVKVGTAKVINIAMEQNNKQLGEVVVTALGIKREKKSLGYAMQEVKGENLVETREVNLANSLTGKIAGLQVVRSSNGPAGSSKMVLRGNNSLTGDNQPLIVIDGVPVNNFTGTTNNDFWNPGLDMGNGISDINPDDIENVSVLKGPSASALYGSRAGNGVILITTKTGKKQQGLGITASSSIGFENVFTNPKMQNNFGQGDNNIFDALSGLSWGPKIEGQNVTNWDGKSMQMAAYDNVSNYLDQGVSYNQNVSFQQQYNQTSVYTSFNYLNDQSMIPGVKLNRLNLMAKALSRFGKGDRWTVDTKVQYTNSGAYNRPQGGPRRDNAFFVTYLLPRSMDITQFSKALDQNNNMYWYNNTNQVNPYWGSQYNLNQDIRDRFILNGALKYEFTNWLNAEVKGGADMYTTNFEAKLYGGSPITSTGQYSLGEQSFKETNFSTLFTAKKDNVIGKLGGLATVGGNLMAQKFTSINSSAGELNARDLFSLNNGKGNPTIEQKYAEKKINSVYGSVQLNWDGYLFVDGTFRNDWSSTLSPANHSYFYPSANVSLVYTDMLEKLGKTLPSWMSYGKIRASLASVGNDLPPYQLYNTYKIGKDPNGNTTAGRNDVLYDPNVRNELIKSYEIGTEMRFFSNRFGFDFALYKSNATHQLIDLPMDPLSGYSSKKINVGDIENKGIELTADGRILNNPKSVNWTVSVNYSTNNNTVNSLGNEVTAYRLGGYDDVKILAVAGQKYGEIYGSKFLRVEDANSPYNGQLLLDANGLPQKGEQNAKLGNQQATSLLGINNALNYKGFGLSFQFDARFGGKIFSGTNVAMQQNGTAAATVVNGGREEMIVKGAVFNQATNSYQENAKAVTPQLYWQTVTGLGNMGITEANIYDASNVRLRNVQLSYDLPAKFLAKTPIQKVKVGLTCNNVWLIQSHMNGVDPESVYATGTNAVGFENASAPTTRTFLFNLSLGF
ncbi:SusC/RagA family TonB-linked outer membrane protein [Solitalea sp. MAHUQ-68]|uniref:SusC/RagA family TonB-linked outer membrane protein n=1 Tax=Solitalea agri TaxID=2953739 RepID=A0A9X2F5X2_9SPHI|nr:SusC/RagA family TonB-linked outer membrane protein [Solitalea agri]MCO4292473.1 SusC/RagA family TonB-linked outer membrane protein [Solitalea agri]